MMKISTTYSPAVRERAMRMVREHQNEHDLQGYNGPQHFGQLNEVVLCVANARRLRDAAESLHRGVQGQGGAGGAGRAQAIHQIAGAHEVHPNQVTTWKREAQTRLKDLFARWRGRRNAREAAEQDALYGQVGRLQVQEE